MRPQRQPLVSITINPRCPRRHRPDVV